ncbi:hypothetical protein ACFSF4_05650 [Paeniglutamicibacter kerguelensis]
MSSTVAGALATPAALVTISRIRIGTAAGTTAGTVSEALAKNGMLSVGLAVVVLDSVTGAPATCDYL